MIKDIQPSSSIIAAEAVAPAGNHAIASGRNCLTEVPVTHPLAPAMGPAGGSASKVLGDQSIDLTGDGKKAISEETVHSRFKISQSYGMPVRLVSTVASEDQNSSRGSPPEYIFIHSHRRSGTHLLIDTVSGWFNIVPGFCHFPPFDKTPLGSQISASPDTHLVKSHEPIYGFTLTQKHIWTSQQHLDENQRLYENNPHVYIVRNPFLVLRSLYIFDLMGGEEKFKINQNLSFHDYLLGKSTHESNVDGKNRIEYWEHHVLNWAARSDVLIINHDDLVQSTTSTLEAISRHVSCPTRSSLRPIRPTGIGRGLTERFLKGGREPVWEPDIANLMEATIQHLAAVQPRMARHVDSWLSALDSGARRNGAAVVVSPAVDPNSEMRGTHC